MRHLEVNSRVTLTLVHSHYMKCMTLYLHTYIRTYFDVHGCSSRTTYTEDLLGSIVTLRFDMGMCPSLAKFSVSRLSCRECKMKQPIAIEHSRLFSGSTAGVHMNDI